jgi:hypothetical protein
MGSPKYENGGKSQSVLIMINPIVSTRTRMGGGGRAEMLERRRAREAARQRAVSRRSPSPSRSLQEDDADAATGELTPGSGATTEGTASLEASNDAPITVVANDCQVIPRHGEGGQPTIQAHTHAITANDASGEDSRAPTASGSSLYQQWA